MKDRYCPWCDRKYQAESDKSGPLCDECRSELKGVICRQKASDEIRAGNRAIQHQPDFERVLDALQTWAAP